MDPSVIVFGSVLVGIGVGITSAVSSLRKSVESDSQKVRALLTDIRDRLDKEKEGNGKE